MSRRKKLCLASNGNIWEEEEEGRWRKRRGRRRRRDRINTLHHESHSYYGINIMRRRQLLLATNCTSPLTGGWHVTHIFSNLKNFILLRNLRNFVFPFSFRCETRHKAIAIELWVVCDIVSNFLILSEIFKTFSFSSFLHVLGLHTSPFSLSCG